MSRFRNFRLDWANHLMGFFSALLGIYIAFGLENYREKNNEKEKVEIAKQAIKKEIEDNLSIYKDNIDKISSWLEYMNFCDKKRNDTDGYQCGTNELDLMVKKYPQRFRDLKEVRNINDTIKIYDWAIEIEVPRTGLSTSNWKTAVSSGLLGSMDYTLTSKLSQIYEWTEKDIGVSEEEFYENILTLNTKDNYLNIDKAKIAYSDFVKVFAFKYDRINEIYSKINWTE